MSVLNQGHMDFWTHSKSLSNTLGGQYVCKISWTHGLLDTQQIFIQYTRTSVCVENKLDTWTSGHTTHPPMSSLSIF